MPPLSGTGCLKGAALDKLAHLKGTTLQGAACLTGTSSTGAAVGLAACAAWASANGWTLQQLCDLQHAEVSCLSRDISLLVHVAFCTLLAPSRCFPPTVTPFRLVTALHIPTDQMWTTDQM